MRIGFGLGNVERSVFDEGNPHNSFKLVKQIWVKPMIPSSSYEVSLCLHMGCMNKEKRCVVRAFLFFIFDKK